MKNIKTLILMALVGMLCFSEVAFGQTAARDQSYKNSDQIAISPYAQAVPNDSYTFIGISHPSLRTAAANIGVVVEAVGMNTTSNTPAGRSAVFTIAGGETHRVFIVNQGHASINSANSAFTDKRTHLITTTDTSQFGSVRVTTVDEDPVDVKDNDHLAQGGAETATVNCNEYAEILSLEGCGYETLNQLNMWGIVYSEAAGTGFAMEFIGDMQDSRLVTGIGTTEHKSGARGHVGPLWVGDGNVTEGIAEHTVQTRAGAGVN
ncbi:hypothetical protein OAM94_00435 [Nitrospinae bacterium]|nr:hypothetical protein [Nitrospinota bacterium]